MSTLKSLGGWFLFGFFGVIALAIVFVKAGKGGGESGGAQTAEIAKGLAGGLGDMAGKLEGA